MTRRIPGPNVQPGAEGSIFTTANGRATWSGGGAAYVPEAYYRPSDGTNWGLAIQRAIDAAHAAGGGTVILADLYTWSGDIVQRGAVAVYGAGTRWQSTTPDTDPATGLRALDSTSRYVYGEFGGGSVDDNPGPLHNLVIDGADVGGSSELFLMQCVDGDITGCHIIRSAGKGVEVGSSQNSVIDRCFIGYQESADPALSFYQTSGAGAGNIKVLNTYFSTAALQVYADSDPVNFWPHDILFDKCLFEQRTEGGDLIFLNAGEFQFERCVISYSLNNTFDPPTNDCVVLVKNDTWTTVSTRATFDGCYFNGGGTGVTDAIRIGDASGVANEVRIYGRNEVTNSDYIVCADGQHPLVSITGPTYLGSGVDWFRAINGGSTANFRFDTATPLRFTMPDADGFLDEPVQLRRSTDTQNRLDIDRDGASRWRDGSSSTVRASLAYDSGNNNMDMGGLWSAENGFAMRYLTTNVSSVGQAVTVSAASTAAPGMALSFTANNATATLTVSDGITGSQLQLLLIDPTTTGNSVTWPSNVHFSGASPQPITGQVVKVDLVKYGTDWYG